MNIERGLLWNQEPAVSRGVQINYTKGKLALSLSWNDGLYSNRYSWVSAAATVTLDSSNTLEFAGGGNLKRTSFSDFATPSSQITRKSTTLSTPTPTGRGSSSPIPVHLCSGAAGIGSRRRRLGRRAFRQLRLRRQVANSLASACPVRVEYIRQHRQRPIGGYGPGPWQGFPIMAANLLYGPGSKRVVGDSHAHLPV